jgi:hypothetical protein
LLEGRMPPSELRELRKMIKDDEDRRRRAGDTSA